MAIFDEEQAEVRKAEKAQRDAVRRDGLLRDGFIHQVGHTPEGLAYFRWLLFISGAIGKNPFSASPEATAFACGQMAVGQTILAHLVANDPTILATLLTETENDKRRPESEPELELEPESRPGENGSAASRYD